MRELIQPFGHKLLVIGIFLLPGQAVATEALTCPVSVMFIGYENTENSPASHTDKILAERGYRRSHEGAASVQVRANILLSSIASVVSVYAVNSQITLGPKLSPLTLAVAHSENFYWAPLSRGPAHRERKIRVTEEAIKKLPRCEDILDQLNQQASSLRLAVSENTNKPLSLEPERSLAPSAGADPRAAGRPAK